MIKYIMIVTFFLALPGCAVKDTETRQTQPIERTEGPSRAVKSMDGSFVGQIVGEPAPRSKFVKLEIGMPMKQVTDLIGEPTDSGVNITGKNFIPFYFGNDRIRMKAFYRGEGYLIFNQQNSLGTGYRLIAIHVDRGESGYAH